MRFHCWPIPLAIVGLLTFSSFATAEDDEKAEPTKLPKAVAKAVKAHYPKAKIRGFAKEKDKEGETIYEVELTVKGKNVDLIIDEEGEIEETERTIEWSDVPKAVNKAITKAYPKAKIQKVEELSLEDDKVLYEIVLELKGKKSLELSIAPNGKIIETASESKEADEDDDDKRMTKKKAKASEKEDMEDDDDEEEDKPKAKKKAKASEKEDMEEDDEDDEDKPKAKKKAKAGEKEEMDEDEDDEDKSKAKKKAKAGEKEEMEDDEDDDEDKPKKKGKSGEKEDDDVRSIERA